MEWGKAVEYLSAVLSVSDLMLPRGRSSSASMDLPPALVRRTIELDFDLNPPELGLLKLQRTPAALPHLPRPAVLMESGEVVR